MDRSGCPLCGNPQARDGTGRGVFRQEGDYWSIVYEGREVRLRDAKGLRYLAILLRHPGERIAAGTLLAETAPVRAAVVDAERARLAVTKALKAALMRIAVRAPALGRHLAATVRRGYACSYTPDTRWPMRWAG
jgi:hypothetical protein